MISVFTIAQRMLEDLRTRKANPAEFFALLDIETPAEITQPLSDHFNIARQREDRHIAGFETSHGREFFQSTLAQYFHRYELPPAVSGYVSSDLSADIKIAEIQMEWGAKKLIKKAYEAFQQQNPDRKSKAPAYRKLNHILDRMQAICAVLDMADFRVGGLSHTFTLEGKIAPADTPLVIDIYNNILAHAYGFGTEVMLKEKDGYPRPANVHEISVHDILRIEKFDRLRKNAYLI